MTEYNDRHDDLNDELNSVGCDAVDAESETDRNVTAETDATEETAEAERPARTAAGRVKQKELKQLREEVAKLTEQLEEARDRYLRISAEYENYRRRTTQEKERLYEDAICKVATAWLAVLDNMERAAEAAAAITSEDAAAVVAGVEMIQRQATEVMKRLNIEEIPALGELFDPMLHEAVLQVDSPEHESQEIVEVLAKGYISGERVIRHSRVKVAR